MNVIAIDPGPTRSAFVTVRHGSTIPVSGGIYENHELLSWLSTWSEILGYRFIAIEGVKSYMQRIGQETLDTAFWSGRFAEVVITDPNVQVFRIFRKDVRKTVCGNGAAKDADIRAAMIDLYGGKEKAIGNKKNRGPLYGVKKDMWQALGLAHAFIDGADSEEIKW